MTDLQQYISSYFGVERSQLDLIGSLFQPEILNKGAYYVKSGRVCDKLSFVKEGVIRIYAHAHEREITQWISTKGYFVTDLSGLIFKTPARWNIQALTDTELYTINHDDYKNIGNLLPAWHELEKLFIAKCFIMLENRIFHHLSLTAEERYDRLFENTPELLNLVPLNYLASMLGMTPETFSRIRRKKNS